MTNVVRAAPQRDFFGRVIERKPQAGTGKGKGTAAGADGEQGQGQGQGPGGDGDGDGAAVRVWYRFNKGFTNAVRRPVKVRELLT
jgi:hypothetical protein